MSLKYIQDVLPVRLSGGGSANKASIKDSSYTKYSSGGISFKLAKCFEVCGHRASPFIQRRGFRLDVEKVFKQSGWDDVHTIVPHSSI